MITAKWKPYGRLALAPDGVGTPSGAEPDASEDILDIFKSDFESSEEPAKEPEPAPEAESSEPAPQEPENVEPASEPEKAPEPEMPKPAEGPSAEALLAQALEVNKRLSEQLAQKQAPQKPSQPEDDEDTKVFSERKFTDYTFNINPKLYEGLFSADATQEERIQCLQAYASGIATTVHNNILATLGKWTRDNFDAIPGVVKYLVGQTNQAAQSSQEIRDGFYKKNPDLNRPELYPLLKATIQAVQKETKAQVWSEQFADTVATRVRGILTGYAQASKPKAAAPIMTPAAAKPAPVVVEKDPNGMEEIIATLNSDF